MARWRLIESLLLALLLCSRAAAGQAPPAADPGVSPEPVVERLDGGRIRVGSILIDQTAGELTVPGTVNPVTVLEYLATTTGGVKSYESALDLEATALEFNLALILLGLDAEHGVPSDEKFDPEPPQGDPVEIWVESTAPQGERRWRAEELVWDLKEQRALAEGPWVYTGSVFLPEGEFLADLVDVLIGFMHTPESIIDSPRPLDSPYGAYQLRTDLGLEAGMPVRLVIRAAGGTEKGPE